MALQYSLSRTYAHEPLFAVLIASLAANWFGKDACAAFMFAEARDCLNLLLVLLAGSIALWAGVFFLAGTDFGRWLDSRGAATEINRAYILTTVVFLASCIAMIACAHVGPQHIRVQAIGQTLAIYSLICTGSMLKNTSGLLKLHGNYSKLLKVVEAPGGARSSRES